MGKAENGGAEDKRNGRVGGLQPNRMKSQLKNGKSRTTSLLPGTQQGEPRLDGTYFERNWRHNMDAESGEEREKNNELRSDKRTGKGEGACSCPFLLP